VAVVGEAQIIVRAITTGFQKDVENGLKDVDTKSLGSRLGNAFSKGFSSGGSRNFSQFRREADAAADAFRRMVTQGYFLGPAISVAAGAISSLVSGLVALTAQVAAALPSLIVLPGLLSAIGQVALTVKLAFGGMGEAIKSLGKARKSSGVDRMPGLLEAYAAAQERVAGADKRVTDALENLRRAQDAARESLQQLNFEAEDAAISQQRASLALEDARATLARVQDLPPNSRARREAELAFAEADLNYRRAIDRNSDLAEETERRNAAGIDGSEEVLSAEEQLLEAQKEQQKALIALAKAYKALNDAREGRGSGGAAAEDPMEKLSKEAQRFAKFIVSLKPRVKELRDAAGEKLFPQLEASIQRMVDKFFPALIPVLRATGDAFGYTADEFSKIITSEANLKNFNKIANTNLDTIRKLGPFVGNLVSIFQSLVAAADPLIRRFTDWLSVLAKTRAETIEARNASGELTEMFNKSGDVAAQLGRVFRNIWEALGNIGRAAAGPGSGGEKLLNAFEGATEKFDEFTARLEQSGRLEQFFNDVADNVIALGGLVSELGYEFIALGDNPAIGETAGKLSGIFSTIGDAMDRLMDGAPALGEFVDKFVDFLAIFAESESINNFFTALNFGLDVLTAIFSNPLIQKIVLFVGAQLAFVKAGQLMFSIGKFAFLTLAGYVGKLFDALKFLGKGFGLLKTGVGALAGVLGIATGPIWIIIGAIAAAVAIFALMYANSEKLREAVSKLIDAVGGALRNAFDIINQAIKDVMPGVDGLGGVFQKLGEIFGWLGDQFAKYVMPVVEFILVNLITNLANAIGGAIRIIAGIIKIMMTPFEVFKALFKLLTGDFQGFLDGMKKAFGGWVDGIASLAKGILQIFAWPLNQIIKFWNNTIASFTIPSWIPFVGGKSIPKIPEIDFSGKTPPKPSARGSVSTGFRMALGGTVMPQRGGALVTIAEAGKPERVEPLDPDGLSKRDKAMIKMFTGGAAGATFNIFPSPGMDEVELAALVNRQIAFELRKGAA